MDYATLEKFFEGNFGNMRILRNETLNIIGNMDVSAWEWDVDFESLMKDEAHGLEHGQKASMRGVSIYRWMKENDEWKIVEAREYGSLTKSSA